jgi:hypothetical protein
MKQDTQQLNYVIHHRYINDIMQHIIDKLKTYSTDIRDTTIKLNDITATANDYTISITTKINKNDMNKIFYYAD